MRGLQCVVGCRYCACFNVVDALMKLGVGQAVCI